MTPPTYAIACKVTGPLPTKDGKLDRLSPELLDKAVESCRSALAELGVDLNAVKLFVTPPRYCDSPRGGRDRARDDRGAH